MSGVFSFFSSAIFIIASIALFRCFSVSGLVSSCEIMIKKTCRYYLAFTQIHVLPLPVEISEDSQVTADIKPNVIMTESPKSSYSNPDLIPTFPKLEDASLLNHWSTATSQHPPSTSSSPPNSSPPPPPRSSSLPPPPRSSPHPSISSRWSPPPTPAHLSFPGGPLLVSLAELAMLPPRVQPVEVICHFFIFQLFNPFQCQLSLTKVSSSTSDVFTTYT